MEERSFLFLIFALVLSGVSVLADCPAGWTLHGKYCYYLTNTRTTNAMAKQACGTHNATLPTFSSPDEWTFLKSMMSSSGLRYNYWVGLEYNVSSKQWAWDDNTKYNKTLAHWVNNREMKPSTSQLRAHYTCAYTYGYSTNAGKIYMTTCYTQMQFICRRTSDTYDMCNEDEGWKDIFGKCYKSYDTKSTWFDARSTCQKEGGTLPSPQKQTDLLLFADLIDCKTKTNDIWTAFTDQYTPGRIQSVDTNQTMKYQAWYINTITPGMNGKTCVVSSAMGNFNFVRTPCIEEKKFVCVKPHGTCPSGWMTVKGTCLKLYNTPQSSTTWFMANDICKKQGLQLLTIKDQATQNAVQKILPSLHVNDIWLGFSDRLKDGTYAWEDGTNLSYHHWYPKNPVTIPGRTDCGAIQSHNPSYWVNMYCYKAKSFICQMPISQHYEYTQQVSNMTCPKNWHLFRSDCYFVGSNKNWQDSRTFCQGLSADLTTVRDELEESFIAVKLKVGYAWIGLKKDTHTTKPAFFWVDNTPLTYSNWYPGRPRDPRYNYDCVDSRYAGTAYLGSWEDYPCSYRRSFICRKPAVGSTASPLAGSTIPWSYRCGPNWIFNGMEGSCYQVIVGAAKNWQDARADCLRRGSDLLCFSGPKEQTFLQAILSSGQYAAIQDWFWIGANDRGREGGWEWVNKQPFRYVNWHLGEPNGNGGEDCGEIVPLWNYQWNDKSCSVTNNYICEKPASPESTVSPPVTQVTQAGKAPCKAEAMISGVYSLPYGQNALVSSSNRDQNHNAEASRITRSNTAAWSASSNDQKQWIQATFYNIIITRGVRVTGRRDTNEWVTKFKLMYQYDFFSPWYMYQDPPGTDKVFNGPISAGATIQVLLNFAIEAKSIKLVPIAWHGGISLKWEILGCIEEDCYAEYGVSGPLFVLDGAFSASSILDPQHAPTRSRLHQMSASATPGCWTPLATDKNPWIEVDLGSVKVVRGVTTAGNPNAAQWVTQYTITYMINDGSNRYYTYQEPYGTNYIFKGNQDNGTLVTTMMKSHFQAQHVRLVVKSFHSAAALRVDFLVCPITCREIPLINGPDKLSDSQLTASSSLNSEHGPQRSRLNQPAQGDYVGGWEAEYNDNKQYIQADLGRVVQLTAVATQGRDDHNQFVRSYTISFSVDGLHWYPYYEGRSVKKFDGNWDSKTVRKHYLQIPRNVRFVRLWPVDWNDRISMRWELYGCPGPMSGAAIGCYRDDPTDRDLPYEPLTDQAAGVWPPSCIHHCYLKGYFYAGLQNGYECFCGNSYGRFGPAANCSMPCFPHPTMKCGGPQANYVHSTGLSFEKVCQAGWQSYGDDCYMLMNDLRAWADARKQCQSLGAELASIDNKNQQDFVLSLMTKGGQNVWIGLNDLQEMFFYEWSNQRSVLYTNWDLKEPSNQAGRKEDCVLINYKTGGWQDYQCDDLHKYLCIAPKTSSSIPTLKPKVEGCQVGWDGFRWSCYMYIQEARSWQDASDVCSSFGATLVRIDDRYEQAYVASKLGQSKGSYWTDVTDSLKAGTFMYSDKVTTAQFTNWANNKPDQNGHCVSLGTGTNAGLWSNMYCNSTLSAVCERTRVGYTTPATPPPTTPSVGCANGWVEEAGYCYLVNNNPINKQLSWDDARRNCEDQNADLASFHNASALDNLWRNYLVGETDHFWIGLNNRDGSGYRWTDRTAVDLTPWGPGEPNNQEGKEQCVEVIIQTGQFNDQQCYNLRNWICSIKKGKTPVTRYPMPVPTAGKPGSCAPFTDDWKMYNGYCYFAQDGDGDNGKSWRKAREYCVSYGADLVSIGGIAEQLFVQKLVANLSDVHVWIGFNELDWDYGFKWSDGSPTKFIDWNANEPNDFMGSESCADMTVFNGKWNDEHCSMIQGFVCKKSQGTAPPVTTPTPLMSGYCPPGFSTFQNRCFKIYTQPKNWTVARQICKGQGLGYDLASVRSAREQAFITTLMFNTNINLWLGMLKAKYPSGMTLRWAFNDDPMTYTNWATGEPNGDVKEKCVHLYASPNLLGQWNDNDCGTRMGFLCETRRKSYITTPEAIPNPCRPGWQTVGQDCFLIVRTPKTWIDASAYCKSNGSYLTSINNAYEQALVYLMASENGASNPIWIGLNDVQKKGKYVWSDVWPLVYTKWGVNEPTRGVNEGCVLLDPQTGLWSDDDCSKKLNFVCRITTASPVFTPKPPSGECPGQNWEEFGSKCYRFMVLNQMKFSDALFQCEEMRANLVSIHDNVTNQFIVSRAAMQSPYTNIWIGLYKSQDSGFSWRDNTPVGYDNWSPGEPSLKDAEGKQEHCVELYSNTGWWNDDSCDKSKGLVCERPKVHDVNLQTFPTIPPHGYTTLVPPPVVSQEVPTPQKPYLRTTSIAPTTKYPTRRPTRTPFKTPRAIKYPTPSPGNLTPVPVQAHDTSTLGTGGIAAIILSVIIVIATVSIVTIICKRRRQSGGLSVFQSENGGITNALYEKHNTEETSA